MIAGLRFPGGPGQRNQRHACRLTGLDSMLAHLSGKWMRRVDQMGNAMSLQIGDQPFNATETANTHRQGLGFKGRDPSRIAESGGNIAFCQSLRQRAGFGCSTQNQDIYHG